MRENNFDFLRLLAAAMVVVGHAPILTGEGSPTIAFGTPIDTLSVYIFFSISGYLVADSWERTPRVTSFFRARCLRIFPALVVVVLLTVFVIGPIASSLPTAAYFRDGETWVYLQGLALLAQYRLPGVFAGSAHALGAVNGSLWTLGVEFSCYIAVAVFGLTLRRYRSVGFVILGLGCIALAVTGPEWGIPKGVLDAARVLPFFCVAACLRQSVDVRTLAVPLAVTALAAWALTAWLWPDSALAVGWIATPIATIGIGRASFPIVRRAARFGDLSYGTYLWAFLIQQCVIDVVGRIPLLLDTVLVLTLSLGIAWMSWNVIEKRALALKSGRDGRYSEPTTVMRPTLSYGGRPEPTNRNTMYTIGRT